ncbi:hypothetical protein Taro_055470 [Colocasia esculenta]|uniref:Inhibitor I9 domain-containing protein n=1 Tax=Colocasia esculenta TaxID=4460 RepID=A0A843XTR4_COLES|nr:hypothetical protein [Colocasia esculenta]
MLCTYDTVTHGFSTWLTPTEVEALAAHAGVLVVIPEMQYHHHATRILEFLGLSHDSGLFSESNSVNDVVVGVLDTGLWPESKSYDNTKFGLVLVMWKGVQVLSLSLGGGQLDYFQDGIMIGVFATMEKVILVSCSAGNADPGTTNLSNVTPWITTVGAGTIHRDFPPT